MIRKTALKRLAAAAKQAAPRSPRLRDLVHGLPPSYLAQKELDRRAAEAKAAKANPAASPEPRETPPEAKVKPTKAKPPAEPQLPGGSPTPTAEKPWYEEMVRWRPRGEADPHAHDDDDDDGLSYYETIHRYDPLERALEEEDYDFDN